MNKAIVFASAVALLCLGGITRADVFNLSPGLTNLETVVVGDADNVGELSGAGAGGFGPDRICGSVGYNYRMGKYEVTSAQYCDFLNHKAKSDPYGLYSKVMSAWSDYFPGAQIMRQGSPGTYAYSVALDWANRPVSSVSFWDACRFCNWLHNGQGDGDTETGAYTLNGYNGQDGRAVVRNGGAKWFLPNVDEWYKAAYYKGGGTATGYWDYPTGSDQIPSNIVVDPDPGNSANIYWYLGSYSIGKPYWRTNVGEFENSASAYDTYDQGGNVVEWNEELIREGQSFRSGPGGSCLQPYGPLRASTHGYDYGYPANESTSAGFRVAAAVPEPTGVFAALCGIAGLCGMAVRRKWLTT